ncbi:MAG TPA: insulinase family protein, partial [Aquaticitalea sp.]|nr:insulinase family protein [Aquaticitalea sp.]
MKKLIILLVALAFTHSLIAQEKELPPKGGTPKGFTLPKKEVIKLDNGLKLVLIPYGAIPKATINISIKTGN